MAKETDWWECPVCHNRITYKDGCCKHMYFDSQVYYGPILKEKYRGAEHEQD